MSYFGETPSVENELKKLRKEIIDFTQWPYGKREVQYQTVDSTLPGIRDMEHRYDIIGFPKSFNG